MNSIFVAMDYRYTDSEPVIVTDSDIEDVRFVLALTPDLDDDVLWSERVKVATERNEQASAALEASLR